MVKDIGRLIIIWHLENYWQTLLYLEILKPKCVGRIICKGPYIKL